MRGVLVRIWAWILNIKYQGDVEVWYDEKGKERVGIVVTPENAEKYRRAR